MDEQKLDRLRALATAHSEAKESRRGAASHGNADQRAEACHAADEELERTWMALADCAGSDPATIIELIEAVRAK